MKKLSTYIRNAPFPASLTIVSFILFLLVYSFINLTSIEPYWMIGLIFALPFLIFSYITYLTAKKDLNKIPSNVITVIFIFTLGFLSLISIFIISIDAATTETTDINKYNRVLRITNYPNNRLTKYFPKEIPDEAKDIVFWYHPAFIQGGEVFGLKFKATPNTINKYINDIKDNAIWIGSIIDDPSDYGIYTSTFNKYGYDSLPEDFTIYVIISDISNHGELSFVAISKARNEIMFYASRW